jgi:hypothetical protein
MRLHLQSPETKPQIISKHKTLVSYQNPCKAYQSPSRADNSGPVEVAGLVVGTWSFPINPKVWIVGPENVKIGTVTLASR